MVDSSLFSSSFNLSAFNHCQGDQDTLSSLAQFRAAIIELFPYARDAAMNIVDALSSFDAKQVIALCLSPQFTRGHDSVTRAIQDYPSGRAAGKGKQQTIDHTEQTQQNHKALHEVQHHAAQKVKGFLPKTLQDKQMVHSFTPTPGQKPIAVGHHLSCLGQVSSEHQWCLPLSLKRVPIDDSQIDFGLAQAESVSELFTDKPCIIAADAKYSSKAALSRSHGWHNTVLLARLSPTRTFYYRHDAEAEETTKNKRGRKKRYGQAFKLKDHGAIENSNSSTPNATSTIIHQTTEGNQWQVKIDRFDDLIVKGAKQQPMHDKPVSLFRIRVFDEQGLPLYEQPLWLVGSGHKSKDIDLSDIFLAYHLRFNIEHWFRFAKGHLLLDRFQTPDINTEDNWWLFPLLATHQLFHARDVATDYAMPWETNKNTQTAASPAQVKRVMAKILSCVGTPASEPKARGMGSGRTLGSQNKSKRKNREIVFKSNPTPMAGSIVIKLPVDALENLSQAQFSAHNLPVSGSKIKTMLKKAISDQENMPDAA